MLHAGKHNLKPVNTLTIALKRKTKKTKRNGKKERKQGLCLKPAEVWGRTCMVLLREKMKNFKKNIQIRKGKHGRMEKNKKINTKKIKPLTSE